LFDHVFHPYLNYEKILFEYTQEAS